MYTLTSTSIYPYISTYTAIKQNTKSCTYVGLYGSGLFNFGSYVSFPTLFTCFFGFDIPTSFILLKMFYIIPVSIFFSEWCKYFLQKTGVSYISYEIIQS